MKVLLTTPLSPLGGYGRDGIGIARAFMRMGADVYLQPTAINAPLPEDVAMLLTKELQAPFDLILNHVDPSLLRATPEMKRAGGMVVGWSMWEYSNFKNLDGRSKLKKNYENFDALVGYDPVSSECYRPFFKKDILTVQGGFEPEMWPEVQRDWNEENFYFCMLGVLSERKDPFVAIQAFRELKDEHEDFNQFARLSLKTSIPGLHSKMEDVYPGLRIYYDTWTTETIRSFYASQHVLLAPSRGEGKNLPCLEFQSTGGTVIATNWGGHTQWLDKSINYPLDYELHPVSPEFPNTLNARASVEHMKKLMLHTFRNRAEVKEKGHRAAELIPKMASWDAVIERLLLQLKTVEGGQALWNKAVVARQGVEHGND